MPMVMPRPIIASADSAVVRLRCGVSGRFMAPRDYASLRHAQMLTIEERVLIAALLRPCGTKVPYAAAVAPSNSAALNKRIEMKTTLLLSLAGATCIVTSLHAGPSDYKASAPPPPECFGRGFYMGVDLGANLHQDRGGDFTLTNGFGDFLD